MCQEVPKLYVSGKKSPKTFLSNIEGIKRKTGSQKFNMILDTIVNVETTEFTLPQPEVFTVNNGVRRKVRRIEHPRFFHLKKNGKQGVITIQGDEVMGNFGGLDVTNQGLQNAETPNIPFEDEVPPAPPTVQMKQTAEQIRENKVILKAEANVLPGNTFPISPQVISKVYVIDYDMYQLLGSNISTCNSYAQTVHANGLQYWNQQGITSQLTKIIVLTSPSPYSSQTSTPTILFQFATDYQNEPGDLIHLLTDVVGGGGLAYLSGVGRQSSNRFCMSCVFTSTTTPTNTKGWTYGWTINVTAHEEGHVVGSRHTQWCGWLTPDGGLGPLDSCFTVESIGQTGCYAGATGSGFNPVNGGTIMSYCHTVPRGGINLNLGFHPQCGEIMRRTLRNSSVPGAPTVNCVWSYGPWGPCVRGVQTRSVTSQIPECKGLPQQLNYQFCTVATSFPVADFVARPLTGNSEISGLDNSTGNPTSWYWEFIRESTGVVASTSTLQYPKVFVQLGSYTVRLTVCNSIGVNQKTVTGVLLTN